LTGSCGQRARVITTYDERPRASWGNSYRIAVKREREYRVNHVFNTTFRCGSEIQEIPALRRGFLSARTLRPQGSLCQLLLTFTVKTSSHTWISRLSREANVKFSVGLDDCLLSACDFRSGVIRVDINPDVTSKPFLTCIDSIQRPSLRLNSLHIRIVTT